MDLQLSGKIALVSGSSSGIGQGIAEVLLSEGSTVFINGRDERKLNETFERLKARVPGSSLYQICSDLASTDTIRTALSTVFSTAGKYPDIVVANIGSGRSVQGWDVDDEEWLRMFNINFFSAVRLTREAINVMKDKGGGSIVCISSIAGCEAISAPVPYSTAKAALLCFVKNMANTVALHNIRINAVSPGNVQFEGGTWDRKMKENEKDVIEYINRTVPMKSFASVYDIANTVAFLSSVKAQFVTGANFVVDGGQVRKFI